MSISTADLVTLYENQGLDHEAAIRAACGGGAVGPATVAPSPRVEVQAQPGVFRFTLPTTPRTKKTSNRICQIPARGGMCKHCGKPCGRQAKCPACGKRVGFTKILPSEAFAEFFKDAMTHAPMIRSGLTRSGASLPLDGYLQVKAIFYRDRNTGDLLGYEQALADWLQEPLTRNGKRVRDGAGVIHDDSQIISWDGSRPAKDAACPRIEVELSVLAARPVEGDLFAEKETEEEW
jgi:hypothetical protein